jgi:tRNA-2-methylthio-N6-dimethylallyladenosine synthase
MKENFYIRTYGCQMNQYEEGVITAIMSDAGYIKVSSEYDADIIYLITCAVRKHAEQRALGRLSFLQGLKKLKPYLIIGILGCMAQELKDVLLNKYGADLVAGPDEYRKLPDMINEYWKSRQSQISVDLTTENYEGIIPKPDNKVTGFISIMRGCNNFCSYCIVPYVRGRERSKSIKQIIKEAEELIKNGVKDITLVGQNVLAWQKEDLNFLDLIKIVNNISGFERLRFITSHPKDLTIEHFEVFASLEKFCSHIHLPLQSGSNRILNLMNRGYTKEEYIDKIETARKIIPDMSFTTDIMVGFPTETDEDFNETLEVIRLLQYDYAYMFKYSERPNTKACDVLPKVDNKISQQRLSKLIDFQNKITEQKSKELLNQNIEVLIESKNGTQSLARTRTNKPVIIKEPVEIGKTYQCKIVNVIGWTPIGEIEIMPINQQLKTNNQFVRR